jgi:HK97 family phage prohead protease
MRATNRVAVEYRGTPFVGTELRETPDGTGGTKLTFTGYASITEAPYEMSDRYGQYSETVARGAFQRTLSSKPDVNFLVNHEGVSMARTRAGSLQLSEDETGLNVQARLDPKRPDVQTIRSAIENGELDEMSFSFRVDPDGDKWNDSGTKRRLISLNMDRGADVSVVNFGASPHTGGSVGLRRLGWTQPAQVSERLRSAGLKTRPTQSTDGRDLDYWRARALTLRLKGRAR